MLPAVKIESIIIQQYYKSILGGEDVLEFLEIKVFSFDTVSSTEHDIIVTLLLF